MQIKSIFLSIIMLFTLGLSAQKSKEAQFFTTKEGAIKGYDVVAYFTLSKPEKG